MNLTRSIACCCTAVALAASCGVEESSDEATRRAQAREENREMDQQLGLLIRVELDADHSFAFFEPRPGMLLSLEEGVQGGEARAISDDVAHLSFSEIYRRLRPGDAIPQVLLDADARSKRAENHAENRAPESFDATLNAGGGALAVDGVEDLGDGIARSSQALTGSQFVAQNGCPDGDMEFCLLYHTGGAYAYADAHYARFNLSPRIGDVYFQLWVGPGVSADFIGSWNCTGNGFYYWTWHLGHTEDCWFVPLPPFELCEMDNDHTILRGVVHSLNETPSVFHYGGLFNH